ncbi:hypothetical protein EPN83_00065 [Patescibacteria group bacterium]|nr:MAG: hypothetical protein EPN83_00065 [Patescibacteria group bacterium]
MATNTIVRLALGTLLLYAAVLGSIAVFGQSDALPPLSPSRWQAVFLSDGQVYFGHLENYNRRFARLTKVYYLKYANDLQQDLSASGARSSAQNLNLIKLGGEVHGPEDAMFLAKDKILFIENLKDSSIVVQAIKKSQP